MRNIVIIGGVSCDPSDKVHDRNPYNFINPGIKLAKKLKNAKVLIHSRSYKIRAKKYPADKEHSWVGKNAAEIKKKRSDHFLKTVTSRVTNVVEVDSANDVTKVLMTGNAINSITYFGHSDLTDLFLEYNTDGSRNGLVTWGIAEAKRVNIVQFHYKSLFASFGCFQGEKNGLCERLQKQWMVRSFGARGKTDYVSIGKGGSYPTGAYFMYPTPISRDDKMDYGKPSRASTSKLYA